MATVTLSPTVGNVSSSTQPTYNAYSGSDRAPLGTDAAHSSPVEERTRSAGARWVASQTQKKPAMRQVFFSVPFQKLTAQMIYGCSSDFVIESNEALQQLARNVSDVVMHGCSLFQKPLGKTLGAIIGFLPCMVQGLFIGSLHLVYTAGKIALKAIGYGLLIATIAAIYSAMLLGALTEGAIAVTLSPFALIAMIAYGLNELFKKKESSDNQGTKKERILAECVQVKKKLLEISDKMAEILFLPSCIPGLFLYPISLYLMLTLDGPHFNALRRQVTRSAF